MATVAKDFKIKNGLIVEGSTGTINNSNILTEASTNTVTNKTINLTSNTLQTTLAQLNTAVSDADVASLAGSETLTNKSMSGSSNTFTNIPNDALSNSSITINGSSVSLGGTRTLGSDDISEGSTNKYFTDERAQDAIGTAIANGTQTNITVTYDDSTNSLSFNASGGVSSLTGTANEIEVSSSTGAVTIGLPNDVTIAGNLTISNAPTQSTHAANKAYVDSVTEGLHIHESVVAATTANVNLANALENGDVLDGITLATGNRILVKNQTTQSENGIYVVQASGQPTRATDFDTAAEVDSGDYVFVYSGTTNASTSWVQTNRPATIGTDAIVFTQFSGAGTFLAGNGLTLTGNTFTIDTSITADLSTAQTLANKTLTSPSVSGLYLSDSSVVFEGSNADGSETTLQVTNPTADRTITLPDASGTVALTSDIPSNTDGLSEGSTNVYFTDERAQDAVASAIAAGTHSNITITYDDATNKFTFAAENGVADSNTDNLTEGSTNLYFTNARAVTALEAVVPNFTEVDINDVATQVAARSVVATASTVSAHTFAKADYRSAKYLVRAKTSSHTELTEVLLTLDGSDNVAITEFGTIGTNGSLMTVTADVSGNDVRLRVTTANNNTDVTVVGTLIASTTI